MRENVVPDFSNWKDHDSYRVAFDRLVRDLQAPARDNATDTQQCAFAMWPTSGSHSLAEAGEH